MTFMIMTYEGEPKFDEKHRIVYNIVEMTDEEMKKKEFSSNYGKYEYIFRKVENGKIYLYERFKRYENNY